MLMMTWSSGYQMILARSMTVEARGMRSYCLGAINRQKHLTQFACFELILEPRFAWCILVFQSSIDWWDAFMLVGICVHKLAPGVNGYKRYACTYQVSRRLLKSKVILKLPLPGFVQDSWIFPMA